MNPIIKKCHDFITSLNNKNINTIELKAYINLKKEVAIYLHEPAININSDKIHDINKYFENKKVDEKKLIEFCEELYPILGELFKPDEDINKISFERKVTEIKSKIPTERYFIHYPNRDEKCLVSELEINVIYDPSGKLEKIRDATIKQFSRQEKIDRIFKPIPLDGASHKTDRGNFFNISNEDDEIIFFGCFTEVSEKTEKSKKETKNTNIFQVTLKIGKVKREICLGCFSTISNINDSAIPFSGWVIFEQAPKDDFLYNEALKNYRNNEPSDKYAAIQHSLIRKTLSTLKYPKITELKDLPFYKSWEEIKNVYTGIYKVIFLHPNINSEDTVETAYLEVKNNGRCLLKLHYRENYLHGVARFDRDTLWIFLNETDAQVYNSRFIMSKNKESLFGVFSCISSKTNKPLSGRAMFEGKKIDSLEDVNAKTQSIPLSQYVFDKQERSFFIDSDEHITDGYSLSTIRNYRFSGELMNILAYMGDRSYYYFTYRIAEKFESSKNQTEDLSVIERNMVEIKRNGDVKFFIKNYIYEGGMSYLHNTLRLSLNNPERGFLEIFLECPRSDGYHDASIFHGISLWRSSKRIQAKTILLVEKKDTNQDNTIFFDFDNKDLFHKEDKNRGVLSYLSGHLNRFIFLSQKNLKKVRPRKKEHREVFFLAACSKGRMLLKEEKPETRELLKKECLGYLKEAMIHGYAAECFAGIPIQHQLLETGDESAFEKHLEAFPIDNEYRERIKEMALEKITLKQVILPGNDLSDGEIVDEIRKLWGWINDL